MKGLQLLSSLFVWLWIGATGRADTVPRFSPGLSSAPQSFLAEASISHFGAPLSLSGEPSDPGRINEQAYLDVTQHWRRPGLLAEDPRSGLLGKHIRILHEYFHRSVRKITSRLYSRIDFPSFLIQAKYKPWYLPFSLCSQPVEDLFKTACKSA